MTLRKKTLLISSVVICCLTLVLLSAASTMLQQGFAALEHRDMEKDVTRADNVLTLELTKLDTMLADWAFWDDAYDFVANPTQAYIKKNLNDDTFATQKLNFVVYMNLAGKMVYGQGFDWEKKQFTPLPQGLLRHLQQGRPLLVHHGDQGAKGILLLPEGPVLIAARPVLDTDKQKPADGTLIVGRYIGKAVIGELADAAQLTLDAYPINALPEEFLQAKAAIDATGDYYIQPVDDKKIAGYAMIKDIYQQPAMLVRVTAPRYIYQQAIYTVRYFIVVFIAAGMLFGAIYLLFLEKTVLARLFSLNRQVAQIGKAGNPDTQVFVSGKDELSQLTQAINNMLKSLTLVQNELRTSDAITHILLDGIPDSLLRLDNDGAILDYKTGRSRMTAMPSRLLPGRHIQEVFPQELAELFLNKILEAIATQQQQVFEYQAASSAAAIRQEFRIEAISEQQVVVIIRDFEKYNEEEQQ